MGGIWMDLNGPGCPGIVMCPIVRVVIICIVYSDVISSYCTLVL